MKIKVIKKNYEDVLDLKPQKHEKPPHQSFLFASLVRLISADLRKVKFKANKVNMDKLNKKEPCLYLMNHCSFLDLQIAFKLIYPKKFNIICSDDGFVGQNFLLRRLGCIATKKYVYDTVLLRDMIKAINKNNHSILMYPEASYSFDGTNATLPDNLGKFLKLLKVPVVMIISHGSFLRDPLYNNLQLRKINVTADMKYILSKKDIEEKSAEELQQIILNEFQYDDFKYQQDNNYEINEPFRADFLNRVLYKCPTCYKEGNMEGKGIKLICKSCNKEYELTKYGYLKALDGNDTFTHIPDWYNYQRKCVKEEIINKTYEAKLDVKIYVLRDYKGLYDVGEGILIHNNDGFKLTGCDGKLEFSLKPLNSYTICSDFYFYQIDDVVCIGNNNIRYCCFPKNSKDIVTKIKLATEELHKYLKSK